MHRTCNNNNSVLPDRNGSVKRPEKVRKVTITIAKARCNECEADPSLQLTKRNADCECSEFFNVFCMVVLQFVRTTIGYQWIPAINGIYAVFVLLEANTEPAGLAHDNFARSAKSERKHSCANKLWFVYSRVVSASRKRIAVDEISLPRWRFKTNEARDQRNHHPEVR